MIFIKFAAKAIKY